MKPIAEEGWPVIKGYADVADLSARRGMDDALYSLWQPSRTERLRILFGAPVAVGVLARKHPPITVVVGRNMIPLAAFGIILLAAGLAGCTQRDRDLQAASDANAKRYSDMRFDSEKRSQEACLKSGGMVVVSEWTGRMRECKR